MPSAPKRAIDHRPLVVASLVAVVSVGLLVIAVALGWLGPDVGRGDGFCEAARPGCVKQPANTWSNLGFVIAGLAVAWHARLPSGALGGRTSLATAYAVLAVVLGPASAAMHATQTDLGGRLDVLSMHLIAGFILAYAVTRLLDAGPVALGVAFVAAVVVAQVLTGRGGHVPWLGSMGNAVFALMLVTATMAGFLARQAGRLRAHVGWAIAAVGSILVALGIWSLSHGGGPWCDPHSLLQGHAIWHLLCAVSTYGLYRAWRAPAND